MTVRFDFDWPCVRPNQSPIQHPHVVAAFRQASVHGISRRTLCVGSSLVALLLTAGAGFAQGAANGGDQGPLQVPAVKVETAPDADGSAADGYRSTTATVGPLGKTPLEDTPYSINVTPGDLIERTEARTLEDALKTNPTVATMLNADPFSMPEVMIRGFSAAAQNEMRDGLVDRSFTVQPMEIVDRIEVQNGMSGFLYGFTNPGGIINYVSKRPPESTLASLASGVYNGGVAYVQADLGGRVPGTDERLGYRFNAYQEGGSTVVDDGQQRRGLVSLSLSYRVRPDTNIWLDAWHQDQETNGLFTMFDAPSGNWSGTRTAVPSATNFQSSKQYGQTWSYNRSSKTLAGGGFDSKLNDTFTIRTGIRFGTMWRQYTYVDAVLQGNAGRYQERANFDAPQNETTRSAYALMDARFDTGRVHHDVTFGYTNTEYYYARAPEVQRILGYSTIANPLDFAQPAVTFAQNNNFQRVNWNNFVVGDQIAINRTLSLLAGVNMAVLNQQGWGSGVAISTASYRAQRPTPTAGVVVKPIENLSLYGSYIQGLEAGDSTTSSTAVNANQVLAPSVSEQYEVGAKSVFGRLGVNLALFRIDKVNAEINPNNNVYQEDGREIHQGVELVTTGKVTDALTLVGGFTVMDAYIAKASALPASDGKIPIDVPEQQARVYLEYAVPKAPDLTISGGMNYYARRPVDVLNTQFLAPATTFDAGLRYNPEIYNHRISATLNALNLFNRAYWTYYRSGDGLLLGAGRTFTFALRFAL